MKQRRVLRILRYLLPYLPQALVAVVLMAAYGLLDAFRILLIGPIFDRVLNPHTPPTTISLMRLPGTSHWLSLDRLVPSNLHNPWTMVAFALVAATLLKGVCDYVGTYLINYAGFGMITDLRDDLYNAILRRSAKFFGQQTTATLLSTIINDVERVQFAMSSVLAEFLQQFFTFIFTGFVVVRLGGRLSWVLLLFVPFVIASATRIGRGVRKTTRKGQDKLAEIQNILHETIAGNRIVKAFSMEKFEMRRFRDAAWRLFRANLRSVRAQALSSPTMDFIGAVAIALLLLLGRNQINQNHITAGFFLAFLVAVFKLYDPVRKFAQFNNNFQQAFGASEQIFAFMDAVDDVIEKPRAIALKSFRDRILFEHVDFCYGDESEERPVLRDVNLEVKAGEILAIVGPSGAGKSTFVNLLPRFFDPTGGRILIDGHDLRELSLESLRSHIGKVTQEIFLFNDTVRNNIAYGRPDVPMNKIEDAAKAALAHDFILRMPEGYDTMIGERGFRISGGERQRLAIARALLKDAPILVLDEATSSLDTESESLVQEALQNLMQDRTVFVVAHRLSTVRRASRIVVLERGSITDIGTHEELINRLGTYQRLYNLQFLDAEQDSVEPVTIPEVPQR